MRLHCTLVLPNDLDQAGYVALLTRCPNLSSGDFLSTTSIPVRSSTDADGYIDTRLPSSLISTDPDHISEPTDSQDRRERSGLPTAST